MPTPPPTHVLTAFGAASGVPESFSGGRGLTYRVGDVVLRPVDDPAEASFLASTFESLRVNDIRVARPLRASDGRWVVAGWTAQRFVSGRPEPRYGEIVHAGEALHEALQHVPEPRFLRARADLHSISDRLAWGAEPDTDRLGDGVAARLYGELTSRRRPVDAVSQIVHGDLFGNVLFAGTAPPAVIDITPYWRPRSWAAAVVVVDALSWGGAGTELIEDWESLPQWPQMLLRALLFRMGFSLMHPRTTPASLVGILSAAEIITPFLD